MAESQLKFFRARVEQARAEGDAATLELVRERHRRSEGAWAMLAARAERSEQLRAAEAERKAGEPLKYTNEEKTIIDQENQFKEQDQQISTPA
jgi:hypothetical protein